MAVDQLEEHRTLVGFGVGREDVVEELVEELPLRDQPAPGVSLQRRGDEDVARLRGELRRPAQPCAFVAKLRDRLVDLSRRKRGDDDLFRLELANRFAGDLHTDHAATAKNQNTLRRSVPRHGILLCVASAGQTNRGG